MSNILKLTFLEHEMGKSARPSTFEASLDDKAHYANLVSVSKSLEDELRLVQRSLCRAKGEEKHRLKSRSDDLTKQANVISLLTRESLVRMRNTQALSKIRKTYSKSIDQNGPLKIFCVSNTEYMKYSEGYTERDLPYSLDVVGIPKLRLYASTLPSQLRFDIVWYQWHTRLPSLITNLDLWRKQSQIARREKCRALIGAPLLVCLTCGFVRNVNR